MTEKTLDNLFEDTLKDIYYAERKVLTTIPKMIKAARSPDLKAAFEKHHAQTQTHVERLDEIFDTIGVKPKGKTCPAIDGILEEGGAIMKEYSKSDAIDAALIASAQAVEHYEITRYGTLKCWAQNLGHTEAVELLDMTLQEESETDEELTQLAENGANDKALQAAA